MRTTTTAAATEIEVSYVKFCEKGREREKIVQIFLQYSFIIKFPSVTHFCFFANRLY